MERFVGDWVRFYRNGALYIGVIEYVRQQTTTYPHKLEYVTSCGVLNEDEVLETRLNGVGRARVEKA